MARARTNVIFAAQAGDGIGAILKTTQPREHTQTVEVVIEVRGTWSSVTVKPQNSLAYGLASPSVFTNVQKLKEDGTLVDVVITADTVIALEIPSDVHFTLDVSGSGSPIPNLDAWAHGDIEAAT